MIVSLFVELLAIRSVELETMLSEPGDKPLIGMMEFDSLVKAVREGKEWEVGYKLRKYRLLESHRRRLLTVAEKTGGEVEKVVNHYLNDDI